jgi:hypothetical protein
MKPLNFFERGFLLFESQNPGLGYVVSVRMGLTGGKEEETSTPLTFS